MPEDITQDQIIRAVASLLPDYPAITLLPFDPLIPEEVNEPHVPPKTPELTQTGPDAIAAERNGLLDAYKREGKGRGVRITDLMIAQAASRKWNERTPVQRWKRNDPRCSAGDDSAIRAVLRKKPHLPD
jgi:hypothetical protein